jgi:hypothetical protein
VINHRQQGVTAAGIAVVGIGGSQYAYHARPGTGALTAVEKERQDGGPGPHMLGSWLIRRFLVTPVKVAHPDGDAG